MAKEKLYKPEDGNEGCQCHGLRDEQVAWLEGEDLRVGYSCGRKVEVGEDDYCDAAGKVSFLIPEANLEQAVSNQELDVTSPDIWIKHRATDGAYNLDAIARDHAAQLGYEQPQAAAALYHKQGVLTSSVGLGIITSRYPHLKGDI